MDRWVDKQKRGWTDGWMGGQIVAGSIGLIDGWTDNHWHLAGRDKEGCYIPYSAQKQSSCY